MSKALRVLLLVSLSFNVMFVIGYFCTPTTAQAPPSTVQAADLLAEKLGLDSQQRDAFLSLRTEDRQQAEAFAQTAGILADELCREAASPTADPKTVDDLQKDLADVQALHQQGSVEHFRRFMNVLTPKQRESAAKMLAAKPASRKVRKSRILQDFDADGNGVLSPAERAKAIQALHDGHESRRETKPKHKASEHPRPKQPEGQAKGDGR